MAINVSVRYNGGLLPDIIPLTQGYYHRGTLSLQPMIPAKRFDEGLDAFRCFFKQQHNTPSAVLERVDC